MSAQFFDVLGVPLVRGLTFQGTDGAPDTETVIISERLRAQFFPGADPIGRQLRFVPRDRASRGPVDVWRTIVVIALLLAAIGLYAVIAYSVAQRTQEIGVRITRALYRGGHGGSQNRSIELPQCTAF